MLNTIIVMLHNLVLSLSDALDLIHPSSVDHQQRVAYVSLRLAQSIGYSPEEQADLMYAAALHDIGVLSVEEKLDTLHEKTVDWQKQAQLGSELLKHLEVFSTASEFVRWHYLPWSAEDQWQLVAPKTRIFSNIIHLSNSIDIMYQCNQDVLSQVDPICKAIMKLSGKEFSPDLVNCFRELAIQESFWLDFSSHRIYSVLLNLIVWPAIQMQLRGLEEVGELFCKIVDFRRAFTATHSARVAAAARKMAEKLCFGEMECRLIKIAGHLHDLGKIAMPNSILEKPGKLTEAEYNIMRGHTYHTFHILSTITGFEEIARWASFHHEHMNGQGYPFHLKGGEIPLGARIMHVADVFAALTENRPYRKALSRQEVESVMQKMVDNGEIDNQIVVVLLSNYQEIENACVNEEASHAKEYARLMAKTN